MVSEIHADDESSPHRPIISHQHPSREASGSREATEAVARASRAAEREAANVDADAATNDDAERAADDARARRFFGPPSAGGAQHGVPPYTPAAMSIAMSSYGQAQRAGLGGASAVTRRC